MIGPLSVGFLAASVAGLVITRCVGHRRLVWSWVMLILSWMTWSLGDLRVPAFAAALATLIRVSSPIIRSGRHRHARRLAVAATLTGFAATRAGPQLVDVVVALWGGDPVTNWWFPVGASFATFQAVMFVMDSDRIPQPPTWLEAALAVSLLPKMLAGPLVRPQRMLDELRTWPRPLLDLRPAFLLAAAAAVKIHVAGEVLHRFVYRDAGGSDLISGWDSILQKLAGPVVFWVNVSALADVAVACGIAIGIRLPQNFDAPLAARNLPELWRRWHVTVSAFFRDYVLRPFTGANPSTGRLAFGLVTVMTMSGFWHGYTVFSALWGTVNGMVLAGIAVRQRRLAQRRITARRQGLTVKRQRTPWWGLPVTLGFFSLISPLLATPHWDSLRTAYTSMGNLSQAPSVTWTTVMVLGVSTFAAAGGWRPLQHRIHAVLPQVPSTMVAALSALVISAAFGFARGAQPAFLYLGIW